MLRIEDLSFNIHDATLQGHLIDDRLLWNVSVEAVPKSVDGVTWKPHAYLDDYPAPSRSFEDVFEVGWSIPDARDLSGGRLLPGQSNCGLYVFEHDFLDNSLLVFSPGEDGVVLTWTGRCSVHWNERYGTDLKFFVQTPIDLLGFWVPASTEREARRMIASVFDINGLHLRREPDREGSYFIPPEQ